VVEDQTILAIGVLVSDLLCHCHNLCEKCRVTGGEFGDIAILLSLRNDEHMQRSLWVDVTDREYPIRVDHDFSGNLTGEDAREDRGFRHGSILCAHPPPSPSGRRDRRRGAAGGRASPSGRLSAGGGA